MSGKRVVITGYGIVSSLGNTRQDVTDILLYGISGIEEVDEWKKLGLKSHIAGTIKNFDSNAIRKEIGIKSKYMDRNSLYSIKAAKDAIQMSGLSTKQVSSEHTSCIVGNGLSSTEPLYRAGAVARGEKQMITPYDINRSMASSCSANIANYYQVKGRSYTLSSACATSLHNIGHAYELIQSGKSTIAITGGAEEVSTPIAVMFNGMRTALANSEQHSPATASRPYDANRSGFVISGGAGILILEELEHAVARGAVIYGEISGFGASSDGYDIISPAPNGDGALRSMQQALNDAEISINDIDYINTHGTSTVVGDIAEAKAIEAMAGEYKVPFSSTKGLSGHGIGAAGAQELIYCLLMIENGFMAGTANIETLDEKIKHLNILRHNTTTNLKYVMSNNFGFGGTNATIIIKKYENE